jgi:hypothetical protein
VGHLVRRGHGKAGIQPRYRGNCVLAP